MSGINVNKYLVIVYTIAGALSGLAGVVLAARVSSGQSSMGMSYELDAIAAAVIGGSSLMGGVGRITGTLIGAMILWPDQKRFYLCRRRCLCAGYY